MKKVLYIVLLLLPVVLLFSCQDSVSPNGPFTEEYSLDCIINADTTFQTAYLSKSYKAGSFNPYDNTSDPALEGANIVLSVNNQKTYLFKEGIRDRRDTTRYKTPLKYYFVDNYKPGEFDNVELFATLKDGKVLKSKLLIPRISFFRMMPFINSPYNPVNPGCFDLSVSWFYNEINPAQEVYFYLELQVIYSKTSNPETKIRVTVPVYYTLNNGRLFPVYPKLSRDLKIKYSRESIKNIINSISEGDPDKGNYIIHECEFTNQLVEKNLAEYIYSKENFNEEFSIRMDPTEISSIQNGYGIFGAYSKKTIKIPLDRDYITSLGYRVSY